jgi:hypothetical protein
MAAPSVLACSQCMNKVHKCSDLLVDLRSEEAADGPARTIWGKCQECSGNSGIPNFRRLSNRTWALRAKETGKTPRDRDIRFLKSSAEIAKQHAGAPHQRQLTLSHMRPEGVTVSNVSDEVVLKDWPEFIRLPANLVAGAKVIKQQQGSSSRRGGRAPRGAEVRSSNISSSRAAAGELEPRWPVLQQQQQQQQQQRRQQQQQGSSSGRQRDAGQQQPRQPPTPGGLGTEAKPKWKPTLRPLEYRSPE